MRVAGTVINRGNNKWELRISMGYDANGKQIRKTKRVTATSIRAARKALDEFNLEVMSQPKGKAGKQMLFEEFVKLWDIRHNSLKSITTQDVHRRLINYRILKEFQGIPLSSITSEQIVEFVGKLRKSKVTSVSGKHENYLSATTVHKYFKLLNHMLSKAVAWKLLKKIPVMTYREMNGRNPSIIVIQYGRKTICSDFFKFWKHCQTRFRM